MSTSELPLGWFEKVMQIAREKGTPLSSRSQIGKVVAQTLPASRCVRKILIDKVLETLGRERV